MTQPNPNEPWVRSADSRIVELVVRLALVVFLLVWSFVLVRPFIPIFVWSVALATALAPLYEQVVVWLGGRRRVAAALVTLLTLVVVIGPASWLGMSLVEVTKSTIEKFTSGELSIAPPPESVKSWPLIGQTVYDDWLLASTNLRSALKALLPLLKPVGDFLLDAVRSSGAGALKFLVSVIIAGFLFSPGPSLAKAARAIARRFNREHGEDYVRLAGATIGAVSRGVIGVALLQAIVAELAMWLVDVPGASLLTIGVLVLSIVQIGPLIICAPLILWSWSALPAPQASAFTVAMLVVNFMDNVLKPFMLARGLTTPTLVIFIGVIGGMLAHGIIGLFAGPVVLAVAWEVARAWIADGAALSTLPAEAPRPAEAARPHGLVS